MMCSGNLVHSEEGQKTPPGSLFFGFFLHLYASMLDGPGTCCVDRSVGAGDVHKCEGTCMFIYDGVIELIICLQYENFVMG